MAPGVVEETGKVASGVVDALRNQPMTLAIIVLNAIIILGIYFAVVDERRSKNEIIKQLISNADKAQDLLAKCIIPQSRAELSPEARKAFEIKEQVNEISN